MRGFHDLGGLPAATIDRREHATAPWERRVDAMAVLLAGKGVLRIDERRRVIESLGAEAYGRLGYYERWIAAISELLIERGVVTVDELGRAMAAAQGRAAAGAGK